MAFKREEIGNSYSSKGQTSSPLDDTRDDTEVSEKKTFDSKQVVNSYHSEFQSSDKRVNTGTVIPQDMTVKLVRADSAIWEIFLSAFFSITLTLAGIFLGAWITTNETASDSFTILEKTATIVFFSISAVLIIIWIVLKVKQSRSGVKIPQEYLSMYGRE